MNRRVLHPAHRAATTTRADQGPLATTDYLIVLEVVALEAGRSFLHLSYAYGYGLAAQAAMQRYLATIGRNKVGFSVVSRGQETTRAYIDDSTITTQVKSQMLSNPNVAGTNISVETLNGTVMLSGFAKNATEMSTAETIARGVKGVKSARNEIAVRP